MNATRPQTEQTTEKKKAKPSRNDKEIRKLDKMINEIKFAMLTTIDADGYIRSRPMMTPPMRFEGSLWFFTGRSTGKVHSIENDQRVNVTYVDADSSKYVSISGRATLVDDRSKARELWKAEYETWFPQGLDDPELSLIKIDVDEAEYWESPAGDYVRVEGIKEGKPEESKELH